MGPRAGLETREKIKQLLFLPGIEAHSLAMQRAGGSRVRIPMRSLDLFILPNPSSRTMALGLTQPLTEMSARNLPGDKSV
jgi:hypothetical protein